MNDKTTASTVASDASTVNNHSTELHQTNQAIRLPSAIRYYLNRYRADLSPHAEHGNDDAVIMMALCDALLESADMLEGMI